MLDPVIKNKMTRAALFSHYDRDNVVDDYVVYYLDKLRTVCDYLVFISSSELAEDEVSKIAHICDHIVTRENAGSDFMNYKVGLSALNVHDYDELVLCNDSVYGPLFPLEEMFDTMHKLRCDFWGITESCEIAYHVQSYFVVFRKKVLRSEIFGEFWKNVTILDRLAIIKKYEVGLSQLLLNNGFTTLAYVRHRSSLLDVIQSRSIWQWFQWIWAKYSELFPLLKNPKKLTNASISILNPTHYFWKQLIAKQRMPFIKINLLRDNPMNMNVKEYDMLISSLSDYDISLIKLHLERIRCGAE